MIADTSFVIDLLKGKKEALQKKEKIPPSEGVSTTTITIFELWSSARYMTPSEEESIKEITEETTIETLTPESAKRAGIICSDLKKKGQEIDNEDCLIAAICLEKNKTLLTRNKEHFTRIPGLKVEWY